MAIELTDDGTLDTVLRCTDCGAELRYNYDDGPEVNMVDAERSPEEADAYAEFVAWAIEDAESEHVCASDEQSEPVDFYVCWNCGQEATRSRPHACDTNH